MNASPDLYADLTVDTKSMSVVAFDGMPLAYHDPTRRTQSRQHVLLAPAGRVEFIVNGPKRGVTASLRSRCVNTGPDGDPNPAMVLADLDTSRAKEPRPRLDGSSEKRVENRAVYRPLSSRVVTQVQSASPQFVVKFTEDKNGFYINGRKYTPADDPMITVDIGSYVHWRIVNATNEIHPFHIIRFIFWSIGKAELPSNGRNGWTPSTLRHEGRLTWSWTSQIRLSVEYRYFTAICSSTKTKG